MRRHVRKRAGFRQDVTDGQLRGLAFLRQLALGDVPDDAGDKGPFLRFQEAEAHVHGEFAPILAPSQEIEAHAHRPRSGFGEVGRAVANVRVPETSRKQHLKRLPQQCLPAVAEELFRLLVDRRDDAFAVDDHDGVRGGVQQLPELELLSPPAGFVLVQRRRDRRLQRPFFKGFDDVPHRLRDLGSLQDVVVRVRRQIHNRDIETEADQVACFDPVHAPLQDDIHQHQIRRMRFGLPDRLLPRSRDGADLIPQT